MKITITDKEERAKNLAKYIIKNKSTIRQAAKKFNVSKSTVHKDISKKLDKISPSLAHKVKQILEINKEQRHIRGGLAIKLKYEKLKLQKIRNMKK